MSTEADVALACMSAFVDGLVSAGVREACVSPGSRSTPLALALARHDGIRVHVHLDERSSAFFALGLAKTTGAPVAVACTSGTAAANLFPAVVEATMARVPLVVLTADRPPELRGVGANQTIDQMGLFGRYVRSFVDVPVPGDEPDLVAWRARGAAAGAAALERPPRPVHVNLPFREPLVPGAGERVSSSSASARVEPGPRAVARTDEAGVSAFLDLLDGSARGVVYAGSLRTGGEDVLAIADGLGWPLLAEPQSGARRPGALAAGRLLIADPAFVEHHTPDVVMQIGAAPTSRAGLSLVGRAGRLLILDPDDLVADPSRRSTRRLVAPPDAVRAALHASRRSDDGWPAAWRAASERVRSAVDHMLDRWDEPFEGRVARDVADAAADGSVLCVGSSMPVRDLDAFMRPRDGLRVLANRGASGIDGFVSTTLGVAASGVPTVALMGDLTLLHDVGALVWNARRGIDAVFVVPNNGGGAIFSSLEQRSLPELEELFTTPHGVDLGAAVHAAGGRHTKVERARELLPAITAGGTAGGIHVVEVVIDAERDRARRDEIHRVVADAAG
ncbi:MAG: 2-succinyl-5-enolpyruvyl-6-hydroxy-3-cyclohexene-1-carboxylic-acid synthase [Actinomycetota bacterium]